MPKNLRPVEADETAKPRRKPRSKTITQAARSGTHVELLEAIQRKLAEAVQSKDTSARDLASLTKRLMDVTDELTEAREAAAEEARKAEDGELTQDEEWAAEAI